MPSAIPVLPQASDLAGPWRLAREGVGCDLSLEPGRLELQAPHAEAWRISGDPACLADLGVGEAAGWRPTPDGVALLRADGSIVAFLSRRAPGFEAVSGDHVGLSLSPR